MDFLGRPFEPVPTLMAVAEYVTKLHAICVVCGAEASRSQKISGGSERIAVGSRGMYEARCRFCHDPHESEQTKMEFIKES
jgi:thymidine kinase